MDLGGWGVCYAEKMTETQLRGNWSSLMFHTQLQLVASDKQRVQVYIKMHCHSHTVVLRQITAVQLKYNNITCWDLAAFQFDLGLWSHLNEHASTE